MLPDSLQTSRFTSNVPEEIFVKCAKPEHKYCKLLRITIFDVLIGLAKLRTLNIDVKHCSRGENSLHIQKTTVTEFRIEFPSF